MVPSDSNFAFSLPCKLLANSAELSGFSTARRSTSSVTFVLSTLYVPSCNRDNTDVVFYRYDGYTFSPAEQHAIQTIAETAVRDACVLLPGLPTNLILRINPGKKVNEDIGATSSHSLPNILHWTVDPSRVTEIARTHLRATLFHHLHRLARLKHRPDVTLMNHVVSLGMATAFERDAGGKTYPWGQYPGEVTAWVTELLGLPATADLNIGCSVIPMADVG